MAIGGVINAPTWVDSGAVITGGLDLLGLRLPVQFIGGTLLDGVTTITPSVRYLTFRAWLIHRYGQSGQPDRFENFINFAARIESALVLGNLSQDRSIGGLIGTDQALERLKANTPRVSISALVKSPASVIYGGPSDQLGITRTREDTVPRLVAERGMPLATTLDQTFAKIALLENVLLKSNVTDVNVDDLFEFGAVARIDQIPDSERELLIDAIIPHKPLKREYARVGTYAALMALALKLKARPSENDLFDAACSIARFGEPILDRVADGWTTYCMRDAIAITQEAVMAAVMGEILLYPDGGVSGVDRDDIISGLMERVEEHDSALRDLGLLKSSESAASLSFRDIQSRIDELLSVDSVMSNGISRWSNTLTETLLYRRALRSGAGALTLSVVAWLVAAQRTGKDPRESVDRHGGLSYQGWRRMGLQDIILPELQRFDRENRSLREVAVELAHRTVQQHFQITWSRLQVDLRRDVALLTAEGQRWFSRGKGFSAGRTASRLQQALGWLMQLSLIDDGGITRDGEMVLERALNTLSEMGVE